MNNLDQKTCFHPCRGTVENACVNNDDRDTMMETMLTVHSKWTRGTCRRTSTVIAGGFTRIYPKDMSKLASWPDFAEACTERVTQRQSGETHGQMC